MKEIQLTALCGRCMGPVPQHDCTLPLAESSPEIIYFVHPGSMWCGACGASYVVTGFRIVAKIRDIPT